MVRTNRDTSVAGDTTLAIPMTSRTAIMTRHSAAALALLVFALVPAAGGQDDALANLSQRAAQAEQRREFGRAIELLSELIAKNSKEVDAYYRRGRANFCAGKVSESVADFDKFVELNPDAESRQWERGISYYYAGQFAKGAKQFELY